MEREVVRGLQMSRFLSPEIEDWMEREVERFMDKLENAGTPIQGGAGIVELMRAAYRRGQEPPIQPVCHDDSMYKLSA